MKQTTSNTPHSSTQLDSLNLIDNSPINPTTDLINKFNNISTNTPFPNQHQLQQLPPPFNLPSSSSTHFNNSNNNNLRLSNSSPMFPVNLGHHQIGQQQPLVSDKYSYLSRYEQFENKASLPVNYYNSTTTVATTPTFYNFSNLQPMPTALPIYTNLIQNKIHQSPRSASIASAGPSPVSVSILGQIPMTILQQRNNSLTPTTPMMNHFQNNQSTTEQQMIDDEFFTLIKNRNRTANNSTSSLQSTLNKTKNRPALPPKQQKVKKLAKKYEKDLIDFNIKCEPDLSSSSLLELFDPLQQKEKKEDEEEEEDDQMTDNDNDDDNNNDDTENNIEKKNETSTTTPNNNATPLYQKNERREHIYKKNDNTSYSKIRIVKYEFIENKKKVVDSSPPPTTTKTTTACRDNDDIDGCVEYKFFDETINELIKTKKDAQNKKNSLSQLIIFSPLLDCPAVDVETIKMKIRYNNSLTPDAEESSTTTSKRSQVRLIISSTSSSSFIIYFYFYL
jgi:hypothetical protein